MREDYPVFVQWYRLLDWILDTVERFPKSARFSLASRMADAALEVLEQIVEAIYTKDRAAILRKANLNIEKLRVMFRLACDRRYVSLRQFEHVSEGLNETGRMIGGWSRHAPGGGAVRHGG